MPQIELVLAIGRYAQRWHLGASSATSVDAAVRRFEEQLAAETRPRCLALPHPSWRNSGWLKRNLWFTEEVLPRLRREVRILLS